MATGLVFNMPSSYIYLFLLMSFGAVAAYNFPYEDNQLVDSDAAENLDIAFGQLPVSEKGRCKTFPGDVDWPSNVRWDVFNTSLGGALLKAVPPAAACYSGMYEDTSKCSLARQGLRSSNFVYVATLACPSLVEY